MIYRYWVDDNFYARLIIYTVMLRNSLVMIHVSRISESAAAHFQHANAFIWSRQDFENIPR